MEQDMCHYNLYARKNFPRFLGAKMVKQYAVIDGTWSNVAFCWVKTFSHQKTSVEIYFSGFNFSIKEAS